MCKRTSGVGVAYWRVVENWKAEGILLLPSEPEPELQKKSWGIYERRALGWLHITFLLVFTEIVDPMIAIALSSSIGDLKDYTKGCLQETQQ